MFLPRAQSEALGTLAFGEAMLRGMGMESGNVTVIARTANIAVSFFVPFVDLSGRPLERPSAPLLRGRERCL